MPAGPPHPLPLQKLLFKMYALRTKLLKNLHAHKNKIIEGVLDGLVGLVFLSHIAILGGNDKIYESEIWHVGLGSTRKNKIIQWVWKI